ncbi:hypothetical protein NK8_63490 (plasmid) [Caballeronia sp. NK8]|uniref:hypothetical protein n=1 Tax=Caballeronia sp. NK8 TaxID=140098 RepID=UPI001BB549AC|nr:hypothetical protein [Caballeronia sp. NK8]BCQ28160.1 hypothetical protein NK8_63490 [Caballeronia sp. NK8]
MSEKMPRFLVECANDHVEQVRTAVKRAVEYCIADKISKIAVIVPALQHVDSSTVAKVLGGENVKAMSQGKVLKVSDSQEVSIALTPAAKAANADTGSLLLAVHLDESDIGKVDDHSRASAIVYCPWTEDAGRQWLRTWQPTFWGTQTWKVPPLGLSPAVEAALKSIHTVVNVSSGLTHTSDKAFAASQFKALGKQGEFLELDDLRIWALRHGWKQSGAKALVKVAGKYAN